MKIYDRPEKLWHTSFPRARRGVARCAVAAGALLAPACSAEQPSLPQIQEVSQPDLPSGKIGVHIVDGECNGTELTLAVGPGKTADDLVRVEADEILAGKVHPLPLVEARVNDMPTDTPELGIAHIGTSAIASFTLTGILPKQDIRVQIWEEGATNPEETRISDALCKM